MNVQDAERLIFELATEVRMVKEGTEGDLYTKPLNLERVANLLIYVAKLKEGVAARNSLEAEYKKISNKFGYSLDKLQQIRDSRFPESAAKVDLLQEMAGKTLDTIAKM
jgi:hypothetical protein